MSAPVLLTSAIALDMLGNTAFQIRRGAVGSHVDGRWVSDTAVVDDAVGALHHARQFGDAAEVLQQHPEFDAVEEAVLVWSRTAMSAATSDASADVVLYAGKEYKVLHMWDRQEGGVYRVLAGRMRDRNHTV